MEPRAKKDWTPVGHPKLGPLGAHLGMLPGRAYWGSRGCVVLVRMELGRGEVNGEAERCGIGEAGVGRAYWGSRVGVCMNVMNV